MLKKSIDIKSIVMFDYGSGLTAPECFKKIKNHPSGFSISLRTIQRYYRRLNEGATTLNHLPIPGRPMSQKCSLIDDIITEDPSLSVYKVAEMVDLSKSAVHVHMHRLDLESHFNEWVPHALTAAQFQRRCRITERPRNRKKSSS